MPYLESFLTSTGSIITQRIHERQKWPPARHQSSSHLFFKFSNARLGNDFVPFVKKVTCTIFFIHYYLGRLEPTQLLVGQIPYPTLSQDFQEGGGNRKSFLLNNGDFACPLILLLFYLCVNGFLWNNRWEVVWTFLIQILHVEIPKEGKTFIQVCNFFEGWNEITPQIHIRKFEEQTGWGWLPCWESFLTSTGSTLIQRRGPYGCQNWPPGRLFFKGLISLVMTDPQHLIKKEEQPSFSKIYSAHFGEASN